MFLRPIPSMLIRRFNIRLSLAILLPSRSYSFNYLTSWTQLQQHVESSTPENFNQFANDAFETAMDIQNQTTAENDAEFVDSKNIQFFQVIDEIFAKGSASFSQSLLNTLLLHYPTTPVALHLIKTYYEKNQPGTVVDKDVALVALRSALWNGDFSNAIKLTDITVGHPLYISKQNQTLKKGFTQLVVSLAAITVMSKYGVDGLIDAGVLSDLWRHLSGLNLMILTYFLNLSFFLTVVKFGRQLALSGGDYLTWQKGTFYTHWFRHADEMLFCSKIVEADRELNRGENTPQLMNELCRTDDDIFSNPHTLKPGYTRDGNKIRLLAAKDNLDDLMMQAYWMLGGDGFEWVEPDQDPALLMWKQHLAKYNKAGVNDGDEYPLLRWAEELNGIDKQ